MPYCPDPCFPVDARPLTGCSRVPGGHSCSPLSSGKHNRIRLRINRSRSGSQGGGKGRVRGRAEPNPGAERGTLGRRPETERRPTLVASSPERFRTTGLLSAYYRSDRSAHVVGTNDEGCLQLSFIGRAKRSLHRFAGGVRVNRQVCGIGENDLRGEGQG
jgi:hypothetical protein